MERHGSPRFSVYCTGSFIRGKLGQVQTPDIEQADSDEERMMIRLARLFVILACAIVAAVPVGAAPLANREVLPNGIRLLFAARPSIPIVVLRAYVRAGSVNDPADGPGG